MMKTIFIGNVEFEMVPVYEHYVGSIPGKYVLVPFNPYGSSTEYGYVLRPLPKKEPVN